MVSAGIIARLLVALIPGNRINPPWGGLGDAPAYVLLAHNIATGQGFAYAGFPTAYRAPIYPLMLATAFKFFGPRALEIVRVVQFLMGLAVAYLCASAAGKLFGGDAKKKALVIALFFPTLLITTGDILTETTATLLSAAYLCFLVSFLQEPSWSVLVALSLCVGIATLTHFNMALLGIVLVAAVLFGQDVLPKWRAVALTIFLSGLVISPWITRNLWAFHGRLLLSSVSGPTAVMGVLTPQGRALSGDSDRLRKALGWVPPADIETNAASRSRFGSEAVLSSKAWKVAFRLWRQSGWRLMPLNLEKLTYFWFSVDQLLSTGSFTRPVRFARTAGVCVYWGMLGLGIGGWFVLRAKWPKVARVFLLYVILVTILHLPFNMNTRLRMPLIDPLLAVLAGGSAPVLLKIVGLREAAESYVSGAGGRE